MRASLSVLKFFFKVYFIGSIRSVLLSLFGSKVNRNEWDSRILIVYLQAIGDNAILTSLLKHYRSAFPDQKIYFLFKDNLGLENAIRPFVDSIIGLSYKKFVSNPFYGLSFINRLRKTGFKTVINHDHSPAEISGKIISLSLNAEKVVGYEGFGIGLRKPFNANIKRNIQFSIKKLYPKFDLIIPSLDKESALKNSFKSLIEHYIYFFEEVTGYQKEDYATQLYLNDDDEKVIKTTLAKEKIELNQYAVLNLGSSASWRSWPVERFAKSSEIFKTNNLPVVLIGAPGEEYLGERFKKLYSGKALDLIGKISISQSLSVIKSSLLVFTNDTSSTHLAIALKKPTLSILSGGSGNSASFYGYKDINVWIRKELACLGDNWQCAANLSPGEIAPCIDAIDIISINTALKNLLSYLKSNPNHPRERFTSSFFK